jgi:lipopolysaccharide export LptBFGC system permease protein LptF
VGCVSMGFLLSATFRQLSSESELVVCDLCGGCILGVTWLAVVVVRFFMGVWRSTGTSPLLG